MSTSNRGGGGKPQARTMAATLKVFSKSQQDETYTKILKSYDWHASLPPRGYQFGIGRGVKPLNTSSEGVVVGGGSGTGGLTTVEMSYFDALDQIKQKQHQASKGTQGNLQEAQISSGAKLTLDSLASVERSKVAKVQRESARDDDNAGEGAEEKYFATDAPESSGLSTTTRAMLLRGRLDTKIGGQDTQDFISKEALEETLNMGDNSLPETWIKRARAAYRAQDPSSGRSTAHSLQLLEKGVRKCKAAVGAQYLWREQLFATLQWGPYTSAKIHDEGDDANDGDQGSVEGGSAQSAARRRFRSSLSPANLLRALGEPKAFDIAVPLIQSAREVVTKAVVACPDSVELWVFSIALQGTALLKEQQGRAALVANPNSIPLYRYVVEQLDTLNEKIALMKVALEGNPFAGALLAILASLYEQQGTHDNVRSVFLVAGGKYHKEYKKVPPLDIMFEALLAEDRLVAGGLGATAISKRARPWLEAADVTAPALLACLGSAHKLGSLVTKTAKLHLVDGIPRKVAEGAALRLALQAEQKARASSDTAFNNAVLHSLSSAELAECCAALSPIAIRNSAVTEWIGLAISAASKGHVLAGALMLKELLKMTLQGPDAISPSWCADLINLCLNRWGAKDAAEIQSVKIEYLLRSVGGGNISSQNSSTGLSDEVEKILRAKRQEQRSSTFVSQLLAQQKQSDKATASTNSHKDGGAAEALFGSQAASDTCSGPNTKALVFLMVWIVSLACASNVHLHVVKPEPGVIIPESFDAAAARCVSAETYSGLVQTVTSEICATMANSDAAVAKKVILDRALRAASVAEGKVIVAPEQSSISQAPPQRSLIDQSHLLGKLLGLLMEATDSVVVDRSVRGARLVQGLCAWEGEREGLLMLNDLSTTNEDPDEPKKEEIKNPSVHSEVAGVITHLWSVTFTKAALPEGLGEEMRLQRYASTMSDGSKTFDYVADDVRHVASYGLVAATLLTKAQRYHEALLAVTKPLTLLVRWCYHVPLSIPTLTASEESCLTTTIFPADEGSSNERQQQQHLAGTNAKIELARRRTFILKTVLPSVVSFVEQLTLKVVSIMQQSHEAESGLVASLADTLQKVSATTVKLTMDANQPASDNANPRESGEGGRTSHLEALLKEVELLVGRHRNLVTFAAPSTASSAICGLLEAFIAPTASPQLTAGLSALVEQFGLPSPGANPASIIGTDKLFVTSLTDLQRQQQLAVALKASAVTLKSALAMTISPAFPASCSVLPVTGATTIPVLPLYLWPLLRSAPMWRQWVLADRQQTYRSLMAVGTPAMALTGSLNQRIGVLTAATTSATIPPSVRAQLSEILSAAGPILTANTAATEQLQVRIRQRQPMSSHHTSLNAPKSFTVAELVAAPSSRAIRDAKLWSVCIQVVSDEVSADIDRRKRGGNVTSGADSTTNDLAALLKSTSDEARKFCNVGPSLPHQVTLALRLAGGQMSAFADLATQTSATHAISTADMDSSAYLSSCLSSVQKVGQAAAVALSDLDQSVALWTDDIACDVLAGLQSDFNGSKVLLDRLEAVLREFLGQADKKRLEVDGHITNIDARLRKDKHRAQNGEFYKNSNPSGSSTQRGAEDDLRFLKGVKLHISDAIYYALCRSITRALNARVAVERIRALEVANAHCQYLPLVVLPFGGDTLSTAAPTLAFPSSLHREALSTIQLALGPAGINMPLLMADISKTFSTASSDAAQQTDVVTFTDQIGLVGLEGSCELAASLIDCEVPRSRGVTVASVMNRWQAKHPSTHLATARVMWRAKRLREFSVEVLKAIDLSRGSCCDGWLYALFALQEVARAIRASVEVFTSAIEQDESAGSAAIIRATSVEFSSNIEFVVEGLLRVFVEQYFVTALPDGGADYSTVKRLLPDDYSASTASLTQASTAVMIARHQQVAQRVMVAVEACRAVTLLKLTVAARGECHGNSKPYVGQLWSAVAKGRKAGSSRPTDRHLVSEMVEQCLALVTSPAAAN